MDLVSIIIPVYNTAKYLERCLDSIQRQIYENIEIIIINDGSIDNSLEICERYASNDERIKIINKANGGLSSARNAGLLIANGKYVAFVDSDDSIEPEMIARLVEVSSLYNTDFSMCDYNRINKDERVDGVTKNLPSGFYSRKDIQSKIFPNLLMGEDLNYGPILSVWCCLYLREFLSINRIKFADEVKWSEDNLFNSIVCSYANKFYYLKGYNMYNYYENYNSITTSYRQGAWQVYLLLNRSLKERFTLFVEYDFSRQLKLNLIYYACNSINQEKNSERRMAIKNINTILNEPALVDALTNFRLPKVNIKLHLLLLLIKFRLTNLIYYIVYKRR